MELKSRYKKEDLIKIPEGPEYRITGCCVYNLFNVITGSFIAFENPVGVYAWDILAGINIAIENDLKVIVNDKKYKGEFLHPSQKYRFKIQQ